MHDNHDDTHDDTHDDFGGLQRDAAHLIDRRRAFAVLGGAGLDGLLAACGAGSSTATSSTTGAPATTGPRGALASPGPAIPSETAGPYPADGSNGPNILTDGAVVRPDITTSIAPYSGTAEGVPTTVQLTVVDATNGDPLPGAAVYLWHCTAEAQYSIYEVTNENYLRGVQEADAAGRVSFSTIFPGCYAGRWPHAHFEVYEGLAEANAGRNAVTTSQFALPQADCEAVYGDARYGRSAANLARLSLTRDIAFADGWEDQLATVAGSNDEGYTVSLLVRV